MYPIISTATAFISPPLKQRLKRAESLLTKYMPLLCRFDCYRSRELLCCSSEADT